jgi:hypothetical protein
VPRKTGIPVGTLGSILNQPHLDVTDWEELA